MLPQGLGGASIQLLVGTCRTCVEGAAAGPGCIRRRARSRSKAARRRCAAQTQHSEIVEKAVPPNSTRSEPRSSSSSPIPSRPALSLLVVAQTVSTVCVPTHLCTGARVMYSVRGRVAYYKLKRFYQAVLPRGTLYVVPGTRSMQCT
jgi:hypothetical protein